MTDARECRRCLLEELESEQALYAAVSERVRLLPLKERAADAEYARRLALCRACDQLHRGACAQCGCYVEIRAARQAMHCAHVHPKW